jgi:hypothetical protein
MAADEWRAFLLEGTRTGKLATVRADGTPHVTPVWFVLDGEGRIAFNTGEDTLKARNLRRSGRASLCVDEERPPYAFVRVDGPVTIEDDPGRMLEIATRIGGRYMGADRAEEFGRRNAVQGELLVRIAPERVVAVAGVSH